MRANRYVSYLATEIEPKALSTLSTFERATEAAFDRIARFNDRGTSKIGTGITAGLNSVRTAANTTSSALRTTSQATDRTQQSLGRAATEANTMSTALFRSAQALNVVQGPLGPLAGRLSSLGYIFRDLAGFSLAGVLGGGGAFALAGIATSYQRVTDSLRPFFDTQTQVNTAMKEVVQIARDSRQALEPVAQLYARLTAIGGSAGIKPQQVGRLTETIAKAARLTGGDPAAQQAGIQQLSQALGSGVLQGEDLRRIKDDTFGLAKAIADGLGVPISKLRELGEQGKTTTEVVVKALERSADEVDAMFAKVPIRVGTALTNAANNLGVFVGRLDESTGATTGFAKAITYLGDHIPTVVTGLGALGVAIASRGLAAGFEKLGTKFSGNFSAQLQDKASAVNSAAARNVAARGATESAQTEVAAIETVIAAIDKKNADILAGGAAYFEEANNARTAAAADVAAIEEVIVARRQEAAQIETNLALIAEQRRESGIAAVEARIAAAAGLPRAGGISPAADRGGQDRKAELVYKQALTTVNEQLAVAEGELAAALDAEAIALQTLNSEMAGAGLAGAQARIAADEQLAVASAAVTVAEEAQTAATLELTGAQRAYAAAATVGARVMGTLQTAGSALSTLLGGPLGIAFGVAAGAVLYFASRTEQAKESADRMRESGDPLIEKLLQIGVAYTTAAEAARAFTIASANATVQKSRDKMLASQADFQTTFREFMGQIDRSKPQGEKDYQRALGISINAYNQRLDPTKALPIIEGLLERNSAAAKSTGVTGFFQRKFGMDPADTGIKSVGLFGDYLDYRTSVQARDQAVADAKRPPQKLPPLLGGGPVVKTKAELQADAQLQSTGGTAAIRARDKYNATKSALDAEYDRRHKETGAKPEDLAAFDKKYQNDLAAAETEYRKVGDAARGAAAGRREHAAAAAAERKATAAQNKALEEAAARYDKLAGIRSKYAPTDESNPFKQGETAKRDIDSLFTSIQNGKVVVTDVVELLDKATGKKSFYTRADAEKDKANVDYAIAKPVREAIQAGQRQSQVLGLIAAGNGNAAQLLQQRYDLEDRIGRDLLPAENAALEKNLTTQQALNDIVAQRTRLIDIQARGAGETQKAIRDLIASEIAKPDLKGIATFGKTLMDSFRNQLADKISVTLFGDKEQETRDKLTRSVDGATTRLKGSADNLDAAATAIKDAVGGLSSAFGTDAGPADDSILGPIPGITAPEAKLMDMSELNATIYDLNEALGINTEATEGNSDIIVRGSRIKEPITAAPKNDPANDSVELATNKRWHDMFSKYFGEGSVLTKIASRMGSFLQGAQYGPVGGGITSALFGQSQNKESKLGASIGGGIGQALTGKGGVLNNLLSTGLESIGKGLGQFAGPLGAIAGSVLGSLVGGLFHKIDRSNATVSGQKAGDVSATGSSTSLKSGAGSLGAAVQAGVTQIADALGGAVGNYLVSIGTFDGKYRVDPAGRTGSLDSKHTPGVVDFGTDGADAAVQYAVLDALRDGAIKGLREGTKRLLEAGTDLNQALTKALSFEGVFKELKQYTDPVGAAVDELNTQFNHLIDIFNEAGASASEFADLQKLYDLKRADAIKSATNGALDNIQDFINGLTSGSQSPLSRQTVYQNAKTNVDAFRGDLSAGKVVDNDKLLAALQSFQDASRNLNGSRGAFFSDFNDILGLAQSAKDNITAGQGALPASPFDPATSQAIQDTATNTGTMIDAIKNGFGDLSNLLRGGGTGAGGDVNGSSFDYLPGFKNNALYSQ